MATAAALGNRRRGARRQRRRASIIDPWRADSCRLRECAPPMHRETAVRALAPAATHRQTRQWWQSRRYRPYRRARQEVGRRTRRTGRGSSLAAATGAASAVRAPQPRATAPPARREHAGFPKTCTARISSATARRHAPYSQPWRGTRGPESRALPWRAADRTTRAAARVAATPPPGARSRAALPSLGSRRACGAAIHSRREPRRRSGRVAVAARTTAQRRSGCTRPRTGRPAVAMAPPLPVIRRRHRHA